jgi:hypothetical protein
MTDNHQDYTNAFTNRNCIVSHFNLYNSPMLANNKKSRHENES